jgi:uncharacterized protein YbaA (DUF1428 family)
MRYVDGYVIPVPKKQLKLYFKIAKEAGGVWRDHGALQFCESAAEDTKSPWAKSFSEQMKLKKGETTVFSWVVFKSRAHRDKVNAKVMKDPRLQAMMDPKKMPFDPKRMVYGGFEIAVDL